MRNSDLWAIGLRALTEVLPEVGTVVSAMVVQQEQKNPGMMDRISEVVFNATEEKAAK